MLKIGLTGGIASGKSLASQYFADLGIDVIDADKIARDLFKRGSPHLIPLTAHFGEDIFDAQGELQRKKLGRVVFSQQNELQWLNEFTHPLISAEMARQIEQVETTAPAYVILDIPLLVKENGEIPAYLNQLIDRVLVIATDLPTQLARLMARDRISDKEAMMIIDNQSSWTQKLACADDVINNNDDQKTLKERVSAMHQNYLSPTLYQN